MVIKIYISSISGNKEIKRQQDAVMQILQTHKVEFEKIDITDPTKEEEKMFMRENSSPKEGQKNPLPPQIFNDTAYCGDFEGLHDANECEEVKQFLKLEEPKSVSKTTVTLEEMNANEKGYMSGISATHENGVKQTENEVRQGVEQETGVQVEYTETSVVSKVTLGVLSSKAGDENDNVKGKSSDESSDEQENGATAAGDVPYERLSEDEVPPHIQPRVVTKSEHRKSKELHDYENVTLTAEVADIPFENIDNEQRSANKFDAERHDDSFHDSIDERDEKNGAGDKVEDDAEQ